MKKDPKDVITFWFETSTPKQWYSKDDAYDEQIKRDFLDTYWQVVRGECSSWRDNPEGRLAEIIVLDQFSRNMFRGEAQSFMYDPLALALAQGMVRDGDDKKLAATHRSFAYMPYMHSESKVVHEEALLLFQSLDGNAEYEVKHKKIIDTFGRYPHRNEILGRSSTPQELEFLKSNSGF